MRSRFAFIIGITGAALFYSFLLYQLAFIPFIGIKFNHYISCLATVVITISCIFFLASFYYRFYDILKFLQWKWMKYTIGFICSFLVVFGWDFIINDITIHFIPKLFIAILFMFAFYDDPNSVRSLNRTMKKTQGK